MCKSNKARRARRARGGIKADRIRKARKAYRESRLGKVYTIDDAQRHDCREQPYHAQKPDNSQQLDHAQQQSDHKQTNFLDLPPEIRLMIFRYVIIDDDTAPKRFTENDFWKYQLRTELVHSPPQRTNASQDANHKQETTPTLEFSPPQETNSPCESFPRNNMAILRVSKLISNEAIEVLYRNTAFSSVIDDRCDYLPFQLYPNTEWIQHLRLEFKGRRNFSTNIENSDGWIDLLGGLSKLTLVLEHPDAPTPTLPQEGLSQSAVDRLEEWRKEMNRLIPNLCLHLPPTARIFLESNDHDGANQLIEACTQNKLLLEQRNRHKRLDWALLRKLRIIFGDDRVGCDEEMV